MTLNFEQIRELLAHRFPFLMIDKVVELEPGKRVVAVKNVTGNEIHFLGHFPTEAVMPGVLIIEAMAQTSFIVHKLSPEIVEKGLPGLKFLVSASVRFLKPVFPGDILRLEVSVAKLIDYGLMVNAVARVEDAIVARGELTLGNRREP